jgi:hypothetical protein
MGLAGVTALSSAVLRACVVENCYVLAGPEACDAYISCRIETPLGPRRLAAPGTVRFCGAEGGRRHNLCSKACVRAPFRYWPNAWSPRSCGFFPKWTHPVQSPETATFVYSVVALRLRCRSLTFRAAARCRCFTPYISEYDERRRHLPCRHSFKTFVSLSAASA